MSLRNVLLHLRVLFLSIPYVLYLIKKQNPTNSESHSELVGLYHGPVSFSSGKVAVNSKKIVYFKSIGRETGAFCCMLKEEQIYTRSLTWDLLKGKKSVKSVRQTDKTKMFDDIISGFNIL